MRPLAIFKNKWKILIHLYSCGLNNTYLFCGLQHVCTQILNIRFELQNICSKTVWKSWQLRGLIKQNNKINIWFKCIFVKLQFNLNCGISKSVKKKIKITDLFRENFLIFVKSSGEKLGWISLLITLMLFANKIVLKVPGVKPCFLDGRHLYIPMTCTRSPG